MSIHSNSLHELAELDRTVTRAEVDATSPHWTRPPPTTSCSSGPSASSWTSSSGWTLAGVHLSPIGGPPPFARPAGSETADPR
jgi:hypothetical protein